MSSNKYSKYFQIDESFNPAINEEIIKNQKDVWKDFYPHESFKKLLQNVKDVLNRKQKLSIWVEGSYGTGKSHAVLTLKKLLDCNNTELKEYFDKYEKELSKDLYNDFYQLKNQDKKILTVHRYGSSDIREDRDLMICVQNSIINALKEKGYEFGIHGTKDGIIEWLSNGNNKTYFDAIIKEPEFRGKFINETADDILCDLKTMTDEQAIQETMKKVSEFGAKKGINTFVLTKETLRSWIVDVIKKNNLSAIVFIWDEFSDYFDFNGGNLSGFQYLAEISESNPFYFIIVTHKSSIFFEKNLSNDEESVRKKINGRFIAPHCQIELPDNMAFILIEHAMKKTEDKNLLKEWEDIEKDLCDLTSEPRNKISAVAKIADKELKGVLPIHPYAALVLKNIAAAFDSNQRSMFDFIKNDRGTDVKGFRWYIEEYGPDDDENAFLTVDGLWDFFYEKGKDQLSIKTRTILEAYHKTKSFNLDSKQQKILKTILLLQAISESVRDNVSLFIPTPNNIALAFEGTGITKNNCQSFVDSLVKQNIIFEKLLGNGEKAYSALIAGGNQEKIEEAKETLEKNLITSKLIEEGGFEKKFALPKYLSLRYAVNLSALDNLKTNINNVKKAVENHPNKLFALYTFARTKEESDKIKIEIKKLLNETCERILFIDYSENYMRDEAYNKYIEYMANSNYYRNQDYDQAKTYANNAQEELAKWKNEIKNATVYSCKDINGTICYSEEDVISKAKEFDRVYFPDGYETKINVIDTMYEANNTKMGAECGITKDLRGTFKVSNVNTKLENQFAGVWNEDRYWEVNKNELLSKYKIAVENVIKTKLDSNEARVSIKDIYDVLEEAPYGFAPCNMSAFILGFILREYASEMYYYTDDLSTSPMSVDRLKEMIDRVIKHQQNPQSNYKDEFIVAMSKEQKEFNKATAFAFNIDESKCANIEETRTRIREQITNKLGFPIWTLKYLDDSEIGSKKESVIKLIDLYVDFINNFNATSDRSEPEIAKDIGELCLNDSDLKQEFERILTSSNCEKGMKKYLETYQDGALAKLVNEINNTGNYINEIKNKFTKESNWVWSKDTVNTKIDELIIEYEIVAESNKMLPGSKSTSYKECLKAWFEKCKQIKVPYQAIKNEVDSSLSSLLEILYKISKSMDLETFEEKQLLNLLKVNETNFGDFIEHQTEQLKRTFGNHLNGLTYEDITKISYNLNDVFTLTTTDFIKNLIDCVNDYKASSVRNSLINLWKDKTKTTDPMDWSNINSMPILCVVPDDEQENARKAFAAFNEQSKDDDLTWALNYLSSINYFANFNDSEVKDKAFKDKMLKQNSVLVDDVSTVKNRIKATTCGTIHPYYWLGNSVIEKIIDDYAFAQYAKISDNIDNTIDKMSNEELRNVVKKLIKESKSVGIEIYKIKKREK